MRQIFPLLLIPITFLLGTCANDIKGDPGQDATLSPLIRIHRPGYRSISSTVISVNGSSKNPIVFKFGSELVSSTTSLFCDITKTGLGGRQDGVTMSATTVYYLYGVRDGSDVGLLADEVDPSTGPTDFTDWTYVGAFVTNNSATLSDFKSSKGIFSADNDIEQITSPSVTFDAIPITVPSTAQFVSGILYVNGTEVDEYGRAAGSKSNPAANSLLVSLQVSGVTNVTQGYVPIFTSKTIYIQTDHASNSVIWATSGWIEDPLEYQ